MLFNSLDFFVFFAIVYLAYLCLPHRGQNRMLLVASYVFYGWWDWRFLSLIFISTLVDYTAGLRLHAASDPRKRRLWLLASLVCNLGLLGFFKYYDFFADSLEASLGALGFDARVLHLHLVLPVGISFYTFQTLSYTIDIYRERLRPTRNFLDFALFVSFFPQLVAGPIERAVSLMPQITQPRRLTPEQFRDGVYLVFWGLFKKVVIADHCALIVNEVFGHHGGHGGAEMLIAVYAFAFQIYGDFSGYTDIARGVSKLMGFELMLNFNLPYFSSNPSEFWRRWHISLSSWLRDYLYISLGGNRAGRFATYRNLMLTMVLGGLWHGASWTMVLWGFYHGLLLVVHRAYTGWRPPRAEQPSTAGRALRILAFFQLTCLGWLIFRARSVGQVLDFLHGIATGLAWTPQAAEFAAQLGLLTVPLVVLQLLQYRSADLLYWFRIGPYGRVAAAFGFAAAALAYWILFQSALGQQQEFIYFQF
jgi:D-alanyl-lipoteichoic acid acyltransferase DltB (MBOAT superfamily)